MKFLSKLFFVLCIFISQLLVAQFKEDYIVTHKHDTIRTMIDRMTTRKIVTHINDKKYKLKTDTIIAGCFMMMDFERVETELAQEFLMRVDTGHVNLYKKTILTSHYNGMNSTTTSTHEYFYIRNGHKGSNTSVLRLSKENLRSVATQCPAILDSLLKTKSWQLESSDIINAYNKICREGTRK